MLDQSWNPKDASDLRGKWDNLKLEITPDMSTEKIIKMQLDVLMFASQLTWPVNQARLYEKRTAAEAKRAYTTAFLLSENKSDRQRDADAKADTKVRIAEAKSDEAEVYRKLLEDLKGDVEKIHYSLRAMLRDHTEEKKWGG